MSILKISITQATRRHVDDCQTALCQSKLGEEYFASEAKAHATLTEGIAKAYVADLVPQSQRGTAYGLFNAAIGNQCS